MLRKITNAGRIQTSTPDALSRIVSSGVRGLYADLEYLPLTPASGVPDIRLP